MKVVSGALAINVLYATYYDYARYSLELSRARYRYRLLLVVNTRTPTRVLSFTSAGRGATSTGVERCGLGPCQSSHHHSPECGRSAKSVRGRHRPLSHMHRLRGTIPGQPAQHCSE